MRRTDFHHEAFFYADVDDFFAGTVPFLRGGLEAGEPVLVAVGRARARALRGELSTGADEVLFVDMEELGRNPARIIPAWRQFVDEHGGQSQPVRGIGEPVWPGRGPAAIDECQRHETLLNHAFWDGPAWRLLCPYDTAGLSDDVLAAAHLSHARVSGKGASEEDAAGASLDPDSVAPFAGALPVRPAAATAFAFDRAALHEARAFAAGEAARHGLSSERGFDLVAAVGELTANSVLHGGGRGVLSVWRQDGALLLDVEDSGQIEEPLAGRLRPAPTQDGGRGLWMVNHLCDLVQIRSGAEGTAIRLRMLLN